MTRFKKIVRILNSEISMKKPNLEISANDAFTDEEIEELSNVLEQVFEVEVKRYEEFGERILAPIILFIFHGITSGFLKAIGKDLWGYIKKKVAEVVAKERKSGVSDLEFHVRTEKGNIRFRLHTSDGELIEKAIDQFPEALKSAEESGYETDYYEFDSKKKEWTP